MLIIVPAVCALALDACSSTQAPSGSSRTVSAASPAASASPSDITLEFAGDVHFTGRTAALLADPATAFGPIASVLRSADFTALNLETAVTSRGTPQPKTYHFQTTPAAFAALRDAGVSLVTLANNHVLDYGQVGLADTLAAARAARFPYVGIGVNADAAWAPYVNAINLARTLTAVRAAKRLAQVVIVFMHWGTEGESCPDANQLALAPQLAAAGADIIIGSHAHELQGSGWLGHTFVAYGMGNFLWWENSSSTATGVLKLTLHPNAPLTEQFTPAVVSSTGQPVELTGDAARAAAAHYASLRACAGLTAKIG